ncbi:hypothetical protein [Streptomyces sp. NPDC057748]|uniref:hypothetical protein n=1 Tax=unclassified Streptomyces TaxID=2593676 RepID=UPI003694DE25
MKPPAPTTPSRISARTTVAQSYVAADGYLQFHLDCLVFFRMLSGAHQPSQAFRGVAAHEHMNRSGIGRGFDQTDPERLMVLLSRPLKGRCPAPCQAKGS